MSLKLVSIGDSLTQGFQSGSISKTHFSYPAILAECLGESNFKIPDFSGAGGLPFNIEAIVYFLANFGPHPGFLQKLAAWQAVRGFNGFVEDYWERGAGNGPSQTGPLHHNVAVWGFQFGDSYRLSEKISREQIPHAQRNFSIIRRIPEQPHYRTIRRTLNPSFDPQYQNLTQIDVAQQLAESEGGIDNLIVFLGANHCLSTVIDLEIRESTAQDCDRLPHERQSTLWRLEDFETVLNRATERLAKIPATHVFIGTIPSVTIPPIIRGVTPEQLGKNQQDAEGYFEYYTYFWVWDCNFSTKTDKYLTRAEVKMIDERIQRYNDLIRAKAKTYGWHIVDICEMLRRLAFRRQRGSIAYEFPTDLVNALRRNPKTRDRVSSDGRVFLDTRYARVDPQAPNPENRYRGGLFSLDGIHPGTIGYGLIAHEFLQVMQSVWKQAGKSVPVHPINWDRIIEGDTLVSNPPINLAALQDTVSFLYNRTPLRKALRLMSGRT